MNKGPLPAGWRWTPLNQFASNEANSFVDGPFGSDLKVSDYEEIGVRILQLQNVGDGHFIDDNKKYTSVQKANSLSRCIVRPNDLLIAKMADPLARCCPVPGHVESGLIVADLIKLRLRKGLDTDFLTAAINGPLFRKEAERLSTGTTRTRISLSTLKRIPLLSPEESEQQRIGNVLRSLQETIIQTESLIAKYQQIKAGLMHDLFTRGVTKDGKLRPTREEAPEMYKKSQIGWIPKEWNAGILNGIVNPARPIVYGILMPGYGYEGGVPVVKVKDIQDGDINTSDLLLTSPIIDEEYRRSRLAANDILLSIRGTVGRVAMVPSNLAGANITQDTARISISTGEPLFHRYFLETPTAERYLQLNTLGVAVQGINLRDVRKMPIPMMNIDEQKQIAFQLQTCNSRVALEKEKLNKMNQLKQGLMHDLLTGHVRVSCINGVSR